MYAVKIEHFEGPLDLLLQLIEGEKLDITQISLCKITDEYLKHLNNLDTKSFDVAEFLIIASKLLYLKSKAILPSFETEEEEEDIKDLEEKLKEYKKYKEAAETFNKILSEDKRAFQKKIKHPEKFTFFTPPQNTDLKNLLIIFNNILSESAEDLIQKDEKVIEKVTTVKEKITEIKNILKKERRCSFRELVNKKGKYEIIISFLAILDLIKQREIKITQNNNFSDIIMEGKKI